MGDSASTDYAGAIHLLEHLVKLGTQVAHERACNWVNADISIQGALHYYASCQLELDVEKGS